jgi:hypothetical protein
MAGLNDGPKWGVLTELQKLNALKAIARQEVKGMGH